MTQEGTRHTKFLPTVSTDTMMISGQSQQISTRNQFITSMKEYQNKSMEELRYEDYVEARKREAITGRLMKVPARFFPRTKTAFADRLTFDWIDGNSASKIEPANSCIFWEPTPGDRNQSSSLLMSIQ